MLIWNQEIGCVDEMSWLNWSRGDAQPRAMGTTGHFWRFVKGSHNLILKFLNINYFHRDQWWSRSGSMVIQIKWGDKLWCNKKDSQSLTFVNVNQDFLLQCECFGWECLYIFVLYFRVYIAWSNTGHISNLRAGFVLKLYHKGKSW